MLDNELNARLVKAFQVLRQEAYRETENGDVADGRLRGCLETHGGLPVVSNALWKKRGVKDVPATYTEARDKVAAGVFTFSTDFETPFIVDKPNGKQAWPDCLVVYRHTGLPVEFKRSECGTIVWNGGLPKTNGIYIYNGSDNEIFGTTFFLGQDMLTEEERSFLAEAKGANTDVANRFNVLLKKASSWSIYARAMFNNPDKVLSNSKRSEREKRVLDYLETMKWA